MIPEDFFTRGRPPGTQKFSDGKQQIFDTSSLSTYCACPRKYQLSVLRRLEPINATNNASTFGNILHSLIETHLKSAPEGAESHNISPSARSAQITLSKHWPDIRKMMEDKSRHRENLVRAYLWYIDHYADDPLIPVELADGPALEVRFQVDLLGFQFSGRLDGLVRDKEGTLWVKDIKTTTQTLGPWYFNYYKPSLQMLLYVGILQRAGIPVRGIIVDAIQILESGIRFARDYLMFHQSQLKEGIEVAQDAMTRARADERFLPNFEACGMYGGCSFRPICASPLYLRDEMLALNYRTSERT